MEFNKAFVSNDTLLTSQQDTHLKQTIEHNSDEINELNSTLSQLLHDLEQVTNSYDRSKMISQTNEILHKIKTNLQTIKHSSVSTPENSTSMLEDWFITHSFAFPEHFSFSMNLSEELIHCVRIEQNKYNQLIQNYQQSVDLLKQRDQEISERLTVFKELYEELSKINQINLIKDHLNSSLWNNLCKMTDELENLCDKMIDTKTRTNTLDPPKSLILVQRTINPI